MRKLFIGIAVTTVIAAAGTLGWQAEAANPAAPVPAGRALHADPPGGVPGAR